MTNKTSITSILIEFLTLYTAHFILLFLLLLVEGFVAACTVLSMVPLADFLLDPSLTDSNRVTSYTIQIFNKIGIPINFWSFGFLFAGLNFINGVCKVGIRYAILKIKYLVLFDLFKNALTSFFEAKWSFFSKSEHGYLLNTLNKEMNTIGDTLGHLATQLAQAVQFLVYLSVPFFLNPKMTMIAILLAIIFCIPFILINKLSYRFGLKNTSTSNKLLGVLSETLQAAKIILGFGEQKKSILRFLKAFNKHVSATLKSQTLAASVPSLFAPFAILAAVIALGISIKSGNELPELVAVLWSLLAAFPILTSLLHANVSINNFIPSYEQLVSLREQAKSSAEIDGDKIFKSLSRSILLKNVSFSYSDGNQIISEINMDIKKGEMTAIVGESGSGKSTIVDLILGLQSADSGKILVDDISLGDLSHNSFRKKIGYVPQDSILFYSSIRDNLLWSVNTASDDEIWEALKLANAHKFVLSLPQGIDTIVGERGVRLSGGQRQRIALARALLRRPELLILDEATSSLDTESEIAIQTSIENLSRKMAILVVAHRLSTISNADKVYILQSGKIVEEGSFANLRNDSGSYLFNLLKIQSAKK